MGQALDEVKHFPRLPPELRHEIWALTLPTTPQLIPYAASRMPVISKINRESRAMFLRSYTKTFLPARGKYEEILRYSMSLYANLSLDMLFFNFDLESAAGRYLYPTNVWSTSDAPQKLKHVAVNQ